MNKGFFITLEGGEGAGKSTQSRFLADYFAKAGYKIVSTREPGGTKEAEKIRGLIVDRDGGNWSSLEETLLLFTARLNHVEHVIKPALARGEIVICDRFFDSTTAYQGYGHGFDLTTIETIKQLTIGDFAPDLTLLFDLSPDIGLARSNRRLQNAGATEDRFEALDIEFHHRLRDGFLKLAAQNQNRFETINAAQSPDDIQREIVKILESKGFKHAV